MGGALIIAGDIGGTKTYLAAFDPAAHGFEPIAERRYETAIIRTLGGRKKSLLRSLLAEFVTLGCLAGLLGALAATLIGAVIAERIFQLSYQPDPRLLVVGLLAGGVGIGVAGMLRARNALEHPPLLVLRSV